MKHTVNRKMIFALFCVVLAMSLTACAPMDIIFGEKEVLSRTNPKKHGSSASNSGQEENSGSEEYSGPDEETYRILAENGYGEGVDWSKQTDDDPNIEKSMDVTRDKDSIIASYRKRFGDDYEAANDYDKPWWDYIPADYDLTGDTFPSTKNYAGREKHYNNSMEQSIIDAGFTSGQLSDLGQIQRIADSFVYEENKNKFKWTADLEKASDVAEKLHIADFDVKTSIRPMLSGDNHWINPVSMTSYYDQSILEYDLIGLPTFGGYKFSITVWEDKGEPVGWIDEYNDTFMNEKEVYENMGEWDFYDDVKASEKTAKIVKPKEPNGVKILKGDTKNLSKEQYIHTKFTGGGMIYYYGNGITVDMSYFTGKSGGSFKEGLNYCRMICDTNAK